MHRKFEFTALQTQFLCRSSRCHRPASGVGGSGRPGAQDFCTSCFRNSHDRPPP
ncbi:hypothetical protein ACFRCW_23675 [Streptomyces sp. NPDC056653]|uniref:hypothetical protein n=1 Tax=Streptomyces sp. NPDC056653 TaxID=3345894 RepID=UPI003693568F